MSTPPPPRDSCPHRAHLPPPQLSGIGPRRELESHGIPVVLDLPGVGESLQDHLTASLRFVDLTNTSYSPGLSLNALKNVFKYFTTKKGPLSICGVEAMTLYNSDTNLAAPDARPSFTPGRPKPPNMQIDFLSTTLDANAMKQIRVHTFEPVPLGDPAGFDKVRQHELVDVVANSDLMTGLLLPTLLHPRSRGSVLLSREDTHNVAKAIIDPRYFSDQRDLDELVEAFYVAREIHAKMRELSPTTIGLEVADPGTLEEVMRVTKLDAPHALATRMCVEEYIRRSAATLYHPTSTCKMGRQSDPMAVVSPANLCVFGTLNLRVADASVMPEVLSGNTNAGAIVVGEKCADMINASLAVRSVRPPAHNKTAGADARL
ncbi:hypothetical protein HK105_207261 [Polyrhizophydium stewartii]|uniref:Glucose-methanol-choline oxidoreductase C-terminal domain-containing protein n=1 Tax=Polyrhizophydium stewartii TaxID=2732419 RepID=A0ABR4N172_9FUNG